jgi:hypothetical protein
MTTMVAVGTTSRMLCIVLAMELASFNTGIITVVLLP